MIPRAFLNPKNKSYFLFGPRGTGKSSFLRNKFPDALYINLLVDEVYQPLLANPSRLKNLIGNKKYDWVIVDEVQKIPALLDEIHWIIEEKKQKFILTGSSARKLRQSGVNLLAGRALTTHSYPLTSLELKEKFNLKKALADGLLPDSYLLEHPKKYLASYIQTYLKEEVLQEGLVRNLSSFARFLEAASFSQAQVLNFSNIARDCSVERKSVTNYFELLEDLLLAKTISNFSIRAKRDLIKQRKFFFFDVGVFKQIRPMGPLDSEAEINGQALETCVFQELIARNEYLEKGYNIYFWHTQKHEEVDFILYGPRGLKAIEVKASTKVRKQDFKSLLEFKKDYPKAELYLIYGGSTLYYEDEVKIIPAELFFQKHDLEVGL